jgi:nucleoside-diphosphate-sugar epimerase
LRVLVTGGGGFLGGAIVRQLLDKGVEVRSFSRKSYSTLAALHVDQHQGDLADTAAVDRAVAGCEAVFHVASLAGAWGPEGDFDRTNVTGTQNVLTACRTHRTTRLIYTSSPSVIFDGSDMEGVDESVPYPPDYEADYPRTKAMAEKAVIAAADETLRTVSLRPHLIWGPGDSQLLPRVIAKQRGGQLRKISGPKKLVDITYIDDAANAHVLAAEALAAEDRTAGISGSAYFISSGQPIEIWTMINRLLAAAGLDPVTRSVSPAAARTAGWVFETAHSLLHLSGEPRMTRWVARELSTAHWFNIGAARRDLGYEPSVDLEEGFRRLRSWLENRPGGS